MSAARRALFRLGRELHDQENPPPPDDAWQRQAKGHVDRATACADKLP